VSTHRDIEVETVVDLHRIVTAVGYGDTAAHTLATG
jgi:hypothetical protein